MFNQTNWIQFQFSAFKVFILIPREIFFIHYRTDYTCSQVNRIRLQQTCIYQHHHMWSSRALLIPAPSPSKNPKCNYSICSPLRAFSYEQCKKCSKLVRESSTRHPPAYHHFSQLGEETRRRFFNSLFVVSERRRKKRKTQQNNNKKKSGK